MLAAFAKAFVQGKKPSKDMRSTLQAVTAKHNKLGHLLCPRQVGLLVVRQIQMCCILVPWPLAF